MIKVEGFRIRDKDFRTLKFVKTPKDDEEKCDPYISLMKDCKLKLTEISFWKTSKVILICSPKIKTENDFMKEYPCEFIGEDKLNSVQKIKPIYFSAVKNPPKGCEINKRVIQDINRIPFLRNDFKTKKVELEISTLEEDDVLLGVLDHFLTTHFRMKKIKVGEENISYK